MLKVIGVTQSKGIPVEVFESLSMLPFDPRYVVNVLKNDPPDERADRPGRYHSPADTVIPSSGSVPAVRSWLSHADGAVYPNTSAWKIRRSRPRTGGLPARPDRPVRPVVRTGESNAANFPTCSDSVVPNAHSLIADCAATSPSTRWRRPPPDTSITGDNTINAAFYFPWMTAPDPLQENRPTDFPPCGFVAGLYARTDSQRGVWKRRPAPKPA